MTTNATTTATTTTTTTILNLVEKVDLRGETIGAHPLGGFWQVPASQASFEEKEMLAKMAEMYVGDWEKGGWGKVPAPLDIVKQWEELTLQRKRICAMLWATSMYQWKFDGSKPWVPSYTLGTWYNIGSC